MTKITLSFDNGPDPDVTPLVLNALKARDIQATFFVIGEKLRDRRYVSERAVGEGHWIGNHTFTHLVPLGHCREAGFATQEIQRTDEALGDLSHARLFFRPYGGGGHLDRGLLNAEAVGHLQRSRHTCIIWNAVPEDWAYPSGWVDRALKMCSALDHAVLVLHDVPTGAMDHLGQFLDRARNSGATFVQDFPESCVLIESGVIKQNMEPFVARH
jgi:peptidoglycan/xylan/chitin deacetylase (PgdA/CDA1 family)